MADVLGYGIVTNRAGDAEAQFDMHLAEVTVDLILGQFVDSPNDVFRRFPEGFANDLELPWLPWCPDGVPSLGLPLVSLFSRCCALRCSFTGHLRTPFILRGLPH
uniref:Uncharacterized protein n=1 Tax=uncultured marine group II/III euryarchaeote KM3_27_D02 TaxID=1456428 RepID=A0A075GWC0_9EURY|nr:hypothetical protein [uncultured marine group II/III euryarchaeote KM3_27_D02]